MKKLAVAVIGGVLAFNTSFGAIDIAVTVQSSFGVNDPTIAGDTFDLPAGALYQLIWTPSLPVYNPAYGYSVYNPLSPTDVGPSEKLLGSWFSSTLGIVDTVGAVGDSVAQGLANDGLVSGYVYTRVFNVGSPTVGDYFNVGGLTGGPLGDQSQANPPASDTSDVAAGDLFTLSIQIVPEPSVLAFLGIGAALVGIRRMRRS